ncbi:MULTISPECIES: hypothetical protein [unclassified Aureimonas]|uniref:hypothetical protein n=1 Tax=unclassified Aureimonas TaxID=2615206 RepID=UPI0012E35E7B|nr:MULTISPECIES: hypothetical protein [unclassified Aureimonas]
MVSRSEDRNVAVPMAAAICVAVADERCHKNKKARLIEPDWLILRAVFGCGGKI